MFPLCHQAKTARQDNPATDKVLVTIALPLFHSFAHVFPTAQQMHQGRTRGTFPSQCGKTDHGPSALGYGRGISARRMSRLLLRGTVIRQMRFASRQAWPGKPQCGDSTFVLCKRYVLCGVRLAHCPTSLLPGRPKSGHLRTVLLYHAACFLRIRMRPTRTDQRWCCSVTGPPASLHCWQPATFLGPSPLTF